LRDSERGDASHVRLNLAHLGWSEHADAVESVLAAALVQIAQAWQLLSGGRYDQLAADFVRDCMLLAELDHLSNSAHCQACFGRSGLVVEASVEHSTVVAGLVSADGGFFLDYRDLGIRKFLA
jgi:hypothetical protein